MAKAVGVSLPVSTKFSVEICRWIRNRRLEEARKMLEEVIKLNKAVPFKRYNWNLGHKKTSNGPGRYPIKTSKEVLKLLKSVEANAQFTGLNTQSLVINHICAHKASSHWHYGRHRGRKMKRTTIEVVVKESAQEKERKKGKEVKSS